MDIAREIFNRSTHSTLDKKMVLTILKNWSSLGLTLSEAAPVFLDKTVIINPLYIYRRSCAFWHTDGLVWATLSRGIDSSDKDAVAYACAQGDNLERRAYWINTDPNGIILVHYLHRNGLGNISSLQAFLRPPEPLLSQTPLQFQYSTRHDDIRTAREWAEDCPNQAPPVLPDLRSALLSLQQGAAASTEQWTNDPHSTTPTMDVLRSYSAMEEPSFVGSSLPPLSVPHAHTHAHSHTHLYNHNLGNQDVMTQSAIMLSNLIGSVDKLDQEEGRRNDFHHSKRQKNTSSMMTGVAGKDIDKMGDSLGDERSGGCGSGDGGGGGGDGGGGLSCGTSMISSESPKQKQGLLTAHDQHEEGKNQHSPPSYRDSSLPPPLPPPMLSLPPLPTPNSPALSRHSHSHSPSPSHSQRSRSHSVSPAHRHSIPIPNPDNQSGVEKLLNELLGLLSQPNSEGREKEITRVLREVDRQGQLKDAQFLPLFNQTMTLSAPISRSVRWSLDYLQYLSSHFSSSSSSSSTSSSSSSSSSSSAFPVDLPASKEVSFDLRSDEEVADFSTLVHDLQISPIQHRQFQGLRDRVNNVMQIQAEIVRTANLLRHSCLQQQQQQRELDQLLSSVLTPHQRARLQCSTLANERRRNGLSATTA